MSRGSRLFVDDAAEAHFSAEGYAVVPVFDPMRLAGLWEDHQRLVGVEDGITFDTIRADRGPLRHATSGAAALWDEVIDDIFVDHQVVFSAFVVKHPGDRSGMAPHDDRSFVDDRTARSATAWIPLVDTGPEEDNGWIGVVPRSHRAAPGLGGTAIAEWFVPYRSVFAEHLVPVPVRAGGAVVWDSRVIHGSPPNRSLVDRPALVVALAPTDAPLVHVRGTSRRGRDIYRVDQEFHLEHSPIAVARRMPEYPVIDHVVDPDPLVDPKVIQKLCGLAEPPVPQTDRPADDRYGPGGTSPRGEPISVTAVRPLAAVLESRTEALVPEVALIPSGDRGDLPDGPVVRVPIDIAESPIGTTETAVLLKAAALAGARLELLVLAGGASTDHDGAAGDAVYLPLTMPNGAAGAAWADGAHPFELGLAVAPPSGAAAQLWNGGSDDLAVLVAHLPAPEPTPAPAEVSAAPPSGPPVRWWQRRRKRRDGSTAATAPPPPSES